MSVITCLVQMDGVCFSKLVVVSTSLLRFMSEHSFSTEQAKWQHDYEVSQYMKVCLFPTTHHIPL